MRTLLFSLFAFIVVSLPVDIDAQYIDAQTYLMNPMPDKKRAPEFSLMGMDGETHTLKEYEGASCL